MMPAIMILAGTGAELAKAALTGVLTVIASLIGAYFLMRTTTRVKASDNVRDITQATIADSKQMRDELWRRFEASDAREHALNERIDHADDENRDLRWQLDRVRAESLQTTQRCEAEIARLTGRVTDLLAEVTSLKERLP